MNARPREWYCSLLARMKSAVPTLEEAENLLRTTEPAQLSESEIKAAVRRIVDRARAPVAAPAPVGMGAAGLPSGTRAVESNRFQESSSSGERGAMPRNIPPSHGETKPYQYALRQESHEREEKEHLARYVINALRLRDGEGLIMDAGSTGLTVFQEYAEKISAEHTHLTFYTNNYQILKFWEHTEDPFIRETQVELLGSQLDRSHQAFFGPVARAMLKPSLFRPAAVIIGCSGINFHAAGGINFSYHAGLPEREFKQMLFQCSCAKKRFILATATKVGFVGAQGFDVLEIKEDIEDFDQRTPICLVTTGPRAGDQETNSRFRRVRERFYSEEMQGLICGKAPGLRFEWIVLDPETGERAFDEFDQASRAGQCAGTHQSL